MTRSFPWPAAFQYPQPHVCPGLAEEGEVHAEPVVLPGRGPGLGEQVLQVFLALGGQPVDDLRPASGPHGVGGGFLGDQASGE